MSVSDKSLKKITKGAGIIFVSLAISKLLGYAYRLIVARLGTDQYGLLSLALGIFGIIVLMAPLGLPDGAMRYIPFYLAKNDRGRAKGVILATLKITVYTSLFFGIILFLLSKPISINIFHNANLAPILKVIAMAIPFYCISGAAVYSLRGLQNVKYEAYINNTIENLIKISLTALFVYLGLGVVGAASAYLIALFITAILIVYFLNKSFPFLTKTIKTVYATKELLSFSLPLVVGGFFVYLLGWVDTIMIGYFKNVSDVGLYNAALPTVQLMNIFPNALIILFVPVMTGLYARRNKIAFVSVYKTVTKWVFVINLGFLALFLLFPQQIVNVLFGPDYIKSASALIILAFGYFLSYFSLTSNHILMVYEKTKLVFFNSCIIFVLNVLLNLLLIPMYGIIGAAIATTLSFFILTVVLLVEVKHIANIHPFKLKYLKILICSLIAAAVLKMLADQFYLAPFHLIIAGGVLFVVVYYLLLLVSRSFEKEDVMILEAFEKRFNLNLGFLTRILRRFS